MKRTFGIIVAAVAAFAFALALAGCSSSSETQADDEGSEILVACFSQTGNTKVIADYAADYYDADFYEIQAADPYTDEDIDYNDDTSRTTTEQNDKSIRPEIDGSVGNMDSYSAIVLAYPIWWGQEPRIIDTFLESYDFSGKTIIPICTSGGSDIETSVSYMKPLVSDSVTWLEGKRFEAGASSAEVDEWLDSVYPNE